MARKNREPKVIQQQNNVLVQIPITANGKCQCKEYIGAFEGRAIPTQTINILPSYIVEWQISYYDKNKNFFELSDILQKLKNINILQTTHISDLKTKISTINTFLTSKPEFVISNNIDDYGFKIGSLNQPMLRKVYSNGIKIDVINRKQQKGKDAQPMVFLLIPISVFSNQSSIINKTANNKTYGDILFDSANLNILQDLVILFGRCSLNHKSDILNILNKL